MSVASWNIRFLTQMKLKGAFGRDNAMTPEELELPNRHHIFNGLCRIRCIGEVNGRYYLTENYVSGLRYKLLISWRKKV